MPDPISPISSAKRTSKLQDPIALPLEVDSPKASPLWDTLHTGIRIEDKADQVSLLSEKRIDDLIEETERLQMEQAQKSKEAIAASQDVTFWSIVEDLSGIASGALSAAIGGVAISSGATYTGGLLIASGITSVSNIAFKYAGGWNFLADTIAQENSWTHEAVRSYVPGAIGLGASVLGVYSSYQLWNAPQIASQLKAMTLLEGASNLISGLTLFGSGMASSRFKRAGAVLFDLQSKGDLAKLRLDHAAEDLSNFHQRQAEIDKQFAQLIRAADQANQSIQQPV